MSDWCVETFSRDVAKEVHAALGSPPRGVAIVDLHASAETHGDEKGVSLFAPGHEYAFRARGRITGVLDGVLALRRRLDQIEAMVLESVHLARHRAGICRLHARSFRAGDAGGRIPVSPRLHRLAWCLQQR